MAQKTLKELLYRTAFATSHDENRYVITGILFRIHEGVVTLVGTDGKRLAKTWARLDIDPTIQGSFILPHKAVEEMGRVLSDKGDKEQSVKVYLMKDKMAFEIENMLLVTKLLVGDYPDVEQIIPLRSPISVQLHREELMALLRQILLFTNDLSSSARFTFQEGELTISANTVDIGEGSATMPVNYSGEKLEIAFNPSYLLDILRHSRDESVTLQLTDSFNPGLWTDHADGLFVLMPMRLPEQMLTPA
jgi:DNA polymerase-3 subunit beta